MRVLHAISAIDPIGGGTASALMGLAMAQARSGMEVSVIATYSAGTDLTPGDRLREAGIAAQMIGPCGGPTFTHHDLVPALDAAIAQADLVHVHAVWEDIEYQAMRLARRHGVPFVVTPHGMLTRSSMSRRWLGKTAYFWLRLRRHLNHAALVHCASEMERSSVARLKLHPPLLVEPLGIDWAEFETLPPAGSLELPELRGRPYILFLGRVHPLKGLELLIPAFAAADLPDTALVVAGPITGSFEPSVREMIARHGLADRVLLAGMLRGPQRVAALCGAALLALPSYHENFGLAVMESLACGRPVIVSDHVGLHPDISAAGVGAVVPLDVSDLARALQRWMHDPSLREAAGQRARSFARERYDWNEIARRWSGHYERVLSRSAATAPRTASG